MIQYYEKLHESPWPGIRMEQSDSGSIEWLSLSDAAKRLNVHPATLRRWADEGQIPVMRTPGGHRRFAATDITHLTERRMPEQRIGPVERIWAKQALKNTRDRILEHQRDNWMERLDERSRLTYRNLGQQLLDLVLQYLTRTEDEEDLLGVAHDIGFRYGEIARRRGFSLTEMLQAFMLFRDTMIGTAIQLPENVSIPTSSQKLLIGRLAEILNRVQLSVAEAYEGQR